MQPSLPARSADAESHGTDWNCVSRLTSVVSPRSILHWKHLHIDHESLTMPNGVVRGRNCKDRMPAKSSKQGLLYVSGINSISLLYLGQKTALAIPGPVWSNN